MQLTIAFRHLASSQSVKDHIEEKMKKLTRFFSKEPVKLHVVLSHERFLYRAEVIVSANHLSFTCIEESQDMYAAIDQVARKLDRQFRRHKEKIKSHKSQRPIEEEGAIIELQEVTQY